MSDNLLNDNKVQGVMINLDRDKPRELRFRQYLDNQRREGITMKESILRLFEQIDTPNIEINTNIPKQNNPGIKTTDQKEEVDSSDFDMI